MLIELIKKLFKALRLDEFDPNTANPNMTSNEKAFLLKCKAESDFWKDTATFASVVKRHQIDDLHLYTYRKLSFVMQDWLKANTAQARELLLQI